MNRHIFRWFKKKIFKPLAPCWKLFLIPFWCYIVVPALQSVPALAAVQGAHMLLLMQRKVNVSDHRQCQWTAMVWYRFWTEIHGYTSGFVSVVCLLTSQLICAGEILIQRYELSICVHCYSKSWLGFTPQPMYANLSVQFMLRANTPIHVLYSASHLSLLSCSCLVIDPRRVDSQMVEWPSYSCHNRRVNPCSLS